MQRIAIINGYTSDRASALLVDESWKNFTSRMKKIRKKSTLQDIFPQINYPPKERYNQKFLRLLLYEGKEVLPWGARVKAEISVKDLQERLIRNLARKGKVEWKKIIF